MNNIKQLVNQTLIYGLSSIVGRLLNYLLVPLYTRVFAPEAYGVVTELYAYVAVFAVLLSFGMETSFFRFANKASVQRNTLLSTSGRSLLIVVSVFSVLAGCFYQPIISFLGLETTPYIIGFVVCILWFDQVSIIPMAHIRLQEKPWLFARIRLSEIGLSLVLNLFFLVLCPYLINTHNVTSLETIYNPAFGVGYIFLSNLIASSVKCIWANWVAGSYKSATSNALFKQLWSFSWPLLIIGIAGIANEVLDRIVLKHLLPYSLAENSRQLGIYGACYKLAVLMTLFTQAFRYGAEPFFFKQFKEKEAPQSYATVFSLFAASGLLIFLIVSFYLPQFSLFIGQPYREGLHIVPILLLANWLLGLQINISIWYKLLNKNRIGSIISLCVLGITIGLNIWLIPSMGYLGAAWATLGSNALLVSITCIIGYRFYPIPYAWSKLFGYIAIALVLFFIDTSLDNYGIPSIAQHLFKVISLIGFVALIWVFERNRIRYKG